MNLDGNGNSVDAEYFYIRNLQGDIIEIIAVNGNTKVTYKYDAQVNEVYYGNIIRVTDNSGIGLAMKNPYRYRSYRYDVESGLYYCNSKYYNPKWYRWISSDDINYLDPSTNNGLNLYVYCGNNPVMNIDSNGNIFFAAIVVGAI